MNDRFLNVKTCHAHRIMLRS